MKGLEYLIKLNDKLSATADKIVGKAKTLGSSLDGLTQKINKLDVTSRSSGGLQNFGNKISSIIPSANAVKTAVVGAAIGLGIYANSVVDTSLKIDNAERVIAFASGAEGAKNIAFLTQEIEDLNLPIVRAYQSFSEVTGAFKDTVLAGQPMRDIFDGVSTAVSAMNLNAETSEGVFKALRDIMSKQKVSAEELVGQLGDRLPGALTIASRAMGKNTSELMKMMENGELMANDFLPRFAAELKKTFQGAAMEAKNSAQGIFNAYQNALTDLKLEIGSTLIPVLTGLAKTITPTIKALIPEMRNFLNVSIQFFSEIYVAISDLIGQLSKYNFHLKDVVGNLGDLFNLIKTIVVDVLGMLSSMDPQVVILLATAFRLASTAMRLTIGLLKVLWSIIGPIVNLFIKFIATLADPFARVLSTAMDLLDKILGKVSMATTAVNDFLSSLNLLNGTKTEVEVVGKVKQFTPGKLEDAGFLNMGGGTNKSKGLGTMPPASSGKVGNTSKEITGGGSRPVNINITVDSFIKGGFTINTTSVKEGASTMRGIIEEELLKILNGANQLAGA